VGLPARVVDRYVYLINLILLDVVDLYLAKQQQDAVAVLHKSVCSRSEGINMELIKQLSRQGFFFIFIFFSNSDSYSKSLCKRVYFIVV
jgi:hypothetical protein